jgi:hypothetical protein
MQRLLRVKENNDLIYDVSLESLERNLMGNKKISDYEKIRNFSGKNCPLER